MKRVIYQYSCDHCGATMSDDYVTLTLHATGVGKINKELCRPCSTIIFQFIKAEKEIKPTTEVRS